MWLGDHSMTPRICASDECVVPTKQLELHTEDCISAEPGAYDGDIA